MKTVTINKTKVKIFEEDDLIQKLGLAKEKSELVLEYQRKFPELLQENNGDFIIDAENLWNQLNKPQGEYAKWFKRKIKPLFLENVDFIEFDKNVGLKNRIVYRHNITTECVKSICLELRNDEALKIYYFLSELDNKYVVIKKPKRKEVEFLDKLEDALNPFDIIGERQFKVLNYKVDFYISNLNIIIEYDEYCHCSYSYEEQEGRQLNIENNLNCKFIRVKDTDSDEYNIGYVIKELFNI